MRKAAEHMFGYAVVDHAFAGNRAFFLRVESRRIVLEILDQCAGFGAFIKNLGLAFIDFAAACHWHIPSKTIHPGASLVCEKAACRGMSAPLAETGIRRN